MATFPTKVANLSTALPRITLGLSFQSVPNNGAAWTNGELRNRLPVRKWYGDLRISRSQFVAFD